MVWYQAKCCEEQEQHDHEQRELDTALGLSLSPVPVSVELDQMMADEEAELHHTMHLSLSPNIDILGAPTNAAASSFIAPRSRIPAASVVQKQPSAPMKIMTQMSDSWMRSYVDNTSMSSTATLQRSGGRRAFADLSVVHQFTLIYWDKVSILFLLLFDGS
jgi:hypothetical protein